MFSQMNFVLFIPTSIFDLCFTDVQSKYWIEYLILIFNIHVYLSIMNQFEE